MEYTVEWLSEMLSNKDLSPFIQKGKKDQQTGILKITKENQIEASLKLPITTQDNGYEGINLDNPMAPGKVDQAKYGEKYFEIDESGNIKTIKRMEKQINEDGEEIEIEVEYPLLKTDLHIMFQKKLDGSWDVYPNPNPYNRDNPAKFYTHITDIKEKEIESQQSQILTGNKMIDSQMIMAYKGYSFETETLEEQDKKKERLIKIDVILDLLQIQFPNKMEFKIKTNDKSQITNREGYLSYDENTKAFTHLINVENDKVIGYKLDDQPEIVKNIDMLNQAQDKEKVYDFIKEKNILVDLKKIPEVRASDLLNGIVEEYRTSQKSQKSQKEKYTGIQPE